MAEKDTIIKGKLKQSGIFNFNEFYEFAYHWLMEEGYDVNEKKYSEKVEGDAKKIEISWEGSKKVSDYFKYILGVEWQILGLKKTEVMREGKKIKTNTGQIEMRFKAVIVKDYESRWEDNPIFKFLRGVYDRYIIRSRIDEYEDKVVEDLDELIAQCKSFLAIEAQH